MAPGHSLLGCNDIAARSASAVFQLVVVVSVVGSTWRLDLYFSVRDWVPGQYSLVTLQQRLVCHIHWATFAWLRHRLGDTSQDTNLLIQHSFGGLRRSCSFENANSEAS